MFGEARRLVAVAELPEPRKVRAVKRLHRADRQSDAVQRERIAFAQSAQLRMWRPAGAHVVFRMDLEKTDRLRRGNDVAKMRRLEADTGARRQSAFVRHRDTPGIAKNPRAHPAPRTFCLPVKICSVRANLRPSAS